MSSSRLGIGLLALVNALLFAGADGELGNKRFYHKIKVVSVFCDSSFEKFCELIFHFIGQVCYF